jgi:hypothetical protein
MLLTLLGYVDFLFTTALMAVLLALGLVAEVLITVLRYLISFVAGDQVNPRMINFGSFLEELRLQSQSDPETLKRLTDVCKYIAMGIVGTVVVVWLARSLRRRGEREGQPRVQRGSLWSNRTFSDDMNELALALLGLVRRPKPAWAGLGDDPRGAVLRSYLMSAALAEERGLPRPPWYTPAEYIPVMRSAFLESGPASSELTALFEVARYSNEPPTAEQGQTAVTLAESLSKTAAPEKRQEVTGAAPVQEQRPADELEIEWRAERMGG